MISEHIQGDRILLDGDTANEIIRALDVIRHRPGISALISKLETRIMELRSACISYEHPHPDDYSVCELLYETGVLENKGERSRYDCDLPLIRSWSDRDRRRVVAYAASIKAAALGGLRRFKVRSVASPRCAECGAAMTTFAAIRDSVYATCSMRKRRNCRACLQLGPHIMPTCPSNSDRGRAWAETRFKLYDERED